MVTTHECIEPAVVDREILPPSRDVTGAGLLIVEMRDIVAARNVDKIDLTVQRQIDRGIADGASHVVEDILWTASHDATDDDLPGHELTCPAAKSSDDVSC